MLYKEGGLSRLFQGCFWRTSNIVCEFVFMHNSDTRELGVHMNVNYYNVLFTSVHLPINDIYTANKYVILLMRQVRCILLMNVV